MVATKEKLSRNILPKKTRALKIIRHNITAKNNQAKYAHIQEPDPIFRIR